MSKFDETGTFFVAFDVIQCVVDGTLGNVVIDAITDHDMGDVKLWWVANESRKVVWENTAKGRVAANKWWWKRNYGV